MFFDLLPLFVRMSFLVSCLIVIYFSAVINKIRLLKKESNNFDFRDSHNWSSLSDASFDDNTKRATGVG